MPSEGKGNSIVSQSLAVWFSHFVSNPRVTLQMEYGFCRNIVNTNIFVAVFRTATITTNSVGEWQTYSMSPLKKRPLNCITISACLCVFIRSPVYKRWLIIMIYAVLFAENQVLFSECFLCVILQPRNSLIIDRVKPYQVTFMWTCWFNLLHSAITFRHFFTVSLVNFWSHDNILIEWLIDGTPQCG